MLGSRLLSRPIVVALIAAFLAAHAWLAVRATIGLGVTGDETVHLTGGYSYWKFNDYRLHPENGNLPQRWAALPLLVSKPNLEPEQNPALWKNSDVWQIGQNFFFESGNSTDFLLLCARSMSVVWSVATGLLVFFWSRSLWGEIAGLFSLALWCVSPTALANAPLVTSDMCATFWMLAAIGAWWRLTERLTVGRLVVSLGAFSLAAVAKFSSVLLLPSFIVIAVWRVFDRNTTADGPQQGRLPSFSRKMVNVMAAGGAHVLAASVTVWLMFGLRYSAFSPSLPAATDFFASFEQILPADGILRWLLVNAREHHVLPEAFLQGFAYVVYASGERPAFAAGLYSSNGWWWYFPFSFFAKSSIAELLVAVTLIGRMCFHFPTQGTRSLLRAKPIVPLLVFGGVYASTSVFSNINIGHRHILPLYPIFLILAGGAVWYRRPAAFDSMAKPKPAPQSLGVEILTKPNAVFGFFAVSIAFIELAAIRPHYLAFFNRIVGGPDNGWRLLSDSSIDWGQNLPRLSDWLDKYHNSGEPVYLSYFGADDPFYRSIQPIELSPYYSFGRELRWASLGGGLYCIGASMLQDASSPYRGLWTAQKEATYQQLRTRLNLEIAQGRRSPILAGPGSPDVELWNLDRARFARLCTYLRIRRPDAIIGHMMFIYRLTDEEIHASVDGTLVELSNAMEAASRR